MKIKLLLALVFVSFLTLVISSYKEGPDYNGFYECTGATGVASGCSGTNGGVTCHSNNTTSNNVVIELDSAGSPVKSYYPGHTYTVKLSGTNGTGANLPYFGFQITSVFLAGAGAQGTVQPAGTWDSAAVPSNVRYMQAGPQSCGTCSGYNIPVIEHNTQIPATSGSGGNGTTYVESFTWSAPPHGSGTVLLLADLNAVNDDQTVTGDYSQAARDTITEAVATGISTINTDLSGFSVYPTLMNDNVTLSFNVKEASNVSVSLVSMEGQTVRTFMTQESLGQGSFKRTFNVDGLSTGVYLVRLQIGNSSLVSKVVKE